MKITHSSQNVTKAQIKPSTSSVILKKALFRFSVINACLLILFFSTSYMSRKKTGEFLNHEFYKKQMTKEFIAFSKINNNDFNLPIALNVPFLITRFFKSSEYKPIWTLNHSITPNAGKIIDLLQKADHYGLNKKAYSINELLKLKENIENAGNENELVYYRKEFEINLTDAGLSFMINLNMGNVLFDTIVLNKSIESLPEYLSEIANEENINNLILNLQPKSKEYVNLQKGLEIFLKSVVLSEETVDIPDFEKNPSQCREKTKQVLVNLGYLNSGLANNDSALILSLKNFQMHHGLTPDGKITKNTIEMLSMSTDERYRKIALNLDRIRKDSRDNCDYIFVNIPSYQLKIVRNSIIRDVLSVVVGAPKTPTPELTSKIDKIIANPKWSVPLSISINEILPKVKIDSMYLSQHNFKVVDKDLNVIEINQVDWQSKSDKNFDYYFVQNSGDANALGLLKFLFKNPYSVYIHDTPSKKYFDYDIRAYSHGCIRLQNPELLAQNLINNNLSNAEKPDIKKLIARQVNKAIELSQPMDIYVRYLTCEADDNYQVYFYKDIYNRDIEQIQSLYN